MIPLLWLDFTIILVIIGLSAPFASHLISGSGQSENEDTQGEISMRDILQLLLSGAAGGVAVKVADYYLRRRENINKEKGEFINKKVRAYSTVAFELTRMIESKHFQAKQEDPKKIEESVKEVDNSIKENLALLIEYALPDWMEVRSNRETLYKHAHIQFVEKVLEFRNKFVKTYNGEICKEYKKIYKERNITRIEPETVTLDDLKFLPQSERKEHEIIKKIKHAIVYNKTIQISHHKLGHPATIRAEPYILGVSKARSFLPIGSPEIYVKNKSTNSWESIQLGEIEKVEDVEVTDEVFLPQFKVGKLDDWDTLIEKIKMPS